MKANASQHTALFCGLALLLSAASSAAAIPGLAQQIPAAEYAALVELYTSTQGENWLSNDGWNDPAAPSWYGVTVSGFQYDTGTGQSVGSVTSLNLGGNRLRGSIPVSLANLVNLQQIYFGASYREDGRHVVFEVNYLNGSIPDLSGIAPLTELDIAHNCFCIAPGSQAQTMIERLMQSGKTVNYQPQNLDCVPGFPGLAQQIPATEYAALVELYTSTHGENWLSSDGWNDPEALAWHGVIVSGFQYDCTTGQVLSVGSVTGLDLSNNQLIGSVPSSLANLVGLQSLSLAINQLSGSIPDWLGSLVNLQKLEISFNQLSGSIPNSLGNLVNLQELDLTRNQLSGSIPDRLGNLVNLNELHLDKNQLSESIPASLGNLVHLQFLGLSNNQLSGSIPDGLGNLVKLNELWLDDNELSGSIPESFINLANLVDLELSNNQLSGNIPDFSVIAPLIGVNITYNCFVISSPQAQTMIERMSQAGKYLNYQPQNLGCGPVAFGDLNNDGCVDQGDLALLMAQIRARSKDLTYDLNGDGKVDVADARFLVLHFTNPDGSQCAP